MGLKPPVLFGIAKNVLYTPGELSLISAIAHLAC